eukprot:jgi/Tetstr1/460914/TSEL_006067.t1
MALPAEAEAFLLLDRPAEEYDASLAALLAKMRTGRPAVMDLVMSLGKQLTSEVDPERARATLLLAEVMNGAPELIQAGQLAHFAGFFADRLSDWKCLRGSLCGCLALLQRRHLLACSSAGPKDAFVLDW